MSFKKLEILTQAQKRIFAIFYIFFRWFRAFPVPPPRLAPGPFHLREGQLSPWRPGAGGRASRGPPVFDVDIFVGGRGAAAAVAAAPGCGYYESNKRVHAQP